MKIEFSAYLDPKEVSLLRRWARDVGRGKIADPLAVREGANPTFGIDKTTLRALPAHKPPRKPGPADILRGWAERQYAALTRTPLRSRREFEAWHEHLVRSASKAWAKQASLELKVHAPYKVVDIFVKSSVRHLPDAPKRERLARWAHAPLDMKSLAMLNDAYGGILLRKGRECSMGVISSERSYHFHQALITCLAAECGTTPLMFDCYAWDHFDARYPKARAASVTERKAA